MSEPIEQKELDYYRMICWHHQVPVTIYTTIRLLDEIERLQKLVETVGAELDQERDMRHDADDEVCDLENRLYSLREEVESFETDMEYYRDEARRYQDRVEELEFELSESKL